MFKSYMSQTIDYRRKVHPIDHPGVVDVLRFLPKEIDVCRFSNVNITTIQLSEQRGLVPKYDIKFY